MPGVEQEPAPQGIEVKNDTDIVLTFKTVVAGEWYENAPRVRLEPGRTVRIFSSRGSQYNLTLSDGCSIGDVVAFGPDGTEVARHPPGLCFDDPQPAWIITASPSPST
jgi:hypothetical protein